MFISDSQSKDIFKISFNIQYKDINILEEFFTEKVSATSVYEIKSKTLESQSEDIWCFKIYCDDEINLISLKKEVQELVKLNNIEIISDIISEKIENKDWVALYQKQLAPIQTGSFFICTTLHQDKLP